MKKLNKIVNIALIYTLIGVFLSENTAYPLSSQTNLRPPLQSDNLQKEVIELLESQETPQEMIVKDTRRFLSELVTKPTDFDWEANKDSLPDLKGFRLSTIDNNGRMTFTPIKNYPFHFHMLGFHEEGWEAVIIDSGVEHGIFNFTVKLTKLGKDPIIKTFQIGRRTRKILGTSGEKGNSKEVLDISDELGKYALQELITKPTDFDWEANKDSLPDLKGFRLRATDSTGRIRLSPAENYSFKFSILGFGEEGWEAVIIDSGVEHGIFNFTVKLTKLGKDPIIKTFQIGRCTRKVPGGRKEKGKFKEVLDISDELGKYALQELITKPTDFDWEANKDSLPDLKGFRLGLTEGYGLIAFSPTENYPFHFPVLGFNEEGWEAIAIDSGVKNKIFQFTVMLTKLGKEPVIRTFQIGRYTRKIPGNHGEKGKFKEVLDISDELGKYALQELITKPTDFDWEANKDSLPDLKGFRLGVAKGRGIMTFSPMPYYNFDFFILGFNEEGWEAIAIDSGVKNKIFQFTVMLTKLGREPVIRTFRIGKYTRELVGRRRKKGSKEKVLNIISLDAVNRFVELDNLERRGFENNRPVPLASDTSGIQQLEVEDILSVLEDLSQNMTPMEKNILQLVMDGYEDGDIASESEITLEWVQNIRRQLQSALSDFKDSDAKYKGEIDISPTTTGSPANFFITLYEYYRDKEITLETLRTRLDISLGVAKRDINRLHKAGLITKEGEGDEIKIKATLRGGVIVYEIYDALRELKPQPRVAQVQEEVRKIIEKFGGTIEVIKGSFFKIIFPKEGYDLRSILDVRTTRTNI